METLEKQIRRTRRRLVAASLGSRLAWCWFFAVLVAAVAIAVGKLAPPPVDQRFWAFGWIGAALFGGSVAVGLWTWIRRPSMLAAAVEIDRRCGLKERVASALALEGAHLESGAGQALARDAAHSIERLDLSERFRVRPDRRALLPLLSATLAFALFALVPVRAPQVPARSTARPDAQAAQSTSSLSKKLAARRRQADERGLDDLDPLLARLEQGTQKLAQTSKNDRKKTLLALGDLTKEAQKRRHELGGASDLRKQLGHLKHLQQGPADGLGQALQNGDLEKAVEQLEKLRRDLAAGGLDPDAEQALARQLDQLQQALAQQAQARESTARRLNEQIDAQRRAGNLAQADRLQQQLDGLEAAQAQRQQQEQIQRQLEAAAQCMGEGDCEQTAAALGQLAKSLEGVQEDLQEMEMLDGVLEQVADCKKAMACQDCDGLGCAACQGDDWTKHGGELDERFRQRGGGKGIGVGLGPGLAGETDPRGKYYDSAVRQQPDKGAAKVVGEADGPNRKGLVRQDIQAGFSDSLQNAADALSEQRLPREYRDHARKYFDTLREGTR